MWSISISFFRGFVLEREDRAAGCAAHEAFHVARIFVFVVVLIGLFAEAMRAGHLSISFGSGVDLLRKRLAS
jgi:hypothetical protein